tara:strand:- start:554 stop:2077 length:1524 start_codon:yes stop_codon:yes gene_type:complete
MKHNKKIYSLNTLGSKIALLKSQGNTIILCHGVFDLLHIGHIKYFEEAKSFGSTLIVTITPDRFVNKGPERPIFSEKHRAEAIAALGSVDYVSINEWPTAIETIKLIEPDFYVKGPDYKDYKTDITGNIKLEEDATMAYGGKMAYTSGITFSSSTLINLRFSNLNEDQITFIKKIKEKYTFNEITEYFEKLNKLKILLVGEAIIDEYIFCDTIGKSGKEPVLVSKKGETKRYAGGILAASNQVSDFCKDGKILSYLGESQEQNKFIEESLGTNITFDFINKSNSPTILKTRFIDNYTKSKTFGVYDMNDELLNEDEDAKLCSKIDNCIDDYDLVIVVDYGHGLITPKVVNLLEKKSRYLAINTQLNSSNVGYHSVSKYHSADYVCIHEGELRHDYRNRNDTLEHLVRDLSKRINSDSILITRGNKGSVCFDNFEFTYCPAYAINVVDRVGAGDTLFAITALCLKAQLPKDLTLLIGNLAAAEMVASIGTGMKLNKVTLLKGLESLLK